MKQIEPLMTIAMRASACGVITCCVLAFVSHQLEVRELMNTLHHQPTYFVTEWVQFVIFATGVTLAFLVTKTDLWRSYKLGGRRGVWWDVVGVLGFFALGFMVVGIMLPSHT